jgi:cell pole-organizing protein PopZ
MEEIIASISRIIAKDKHGAERRVEATASSGVAVSTTKGDILDLTQVVNEDGSMREVPPWAGDAALSRLPDAPIASPAEAASRADPVLEPRPGSGGERIVSATTSEVVAATFAQLRALPRERRDEPELPLGGVERTLEEIVREMLRPLLQAWLDTHLPGIVGQLVREEIARVVGEAGLR